MGKKVILLRPFVFSSPAIGEHAKLSREQKFLPQKNSQTGEWIPTEVELPDEVAEHPFIHKEFADGCIERPEVTAARIKAVQAKLDVEKVISDRELQKAEDALKRASGSHAVHKVNEDDVTRQLNTPVNQLGAQRGKSIDEAALSDALNTPANELASGNVKPAKAGK